MFWSGVSWNWLDAIEPSVPTGRLYVEPFVAFTFPNEFSDIATGEEPTYRPPVTNGIDELLVLRDLLVNRFGTGKIAP